MPIQAQSADGVMHEFPDGTNPTVIDKVMKEYVAQKPQSPPSAPQDGTPQFLKPITNIPGEIGKDFSAGTATVRQGEQDLFGKDKSLGQRGMGALNTGLGALEQLGSPVSGAVRSLVSDPVRETKLPGSQTAAGALDVAGGFIGPGGAAKGISAASKAIGELSATMRASKAMSEAAKAANLREGAQAARSAGYVLPPSAAMEKPGETGSLASAFSGDAKLAQAASVKNQKITNDLAAKDLGLPKGTPLLPATTEAVRDKAGKVWDDVRKAVPEVKPRGDKQFEKAVEKIGMDPMMKEHFPETSHDGEIAKIQGDLLHSEKIPIDVALQKIKDWRSDATANFKATDDPTKLKIAFAQRGAADALEDLIERSLPKGSEGLLSQLRKARTTIAKTYAIDAASNETTGNVNAQRLAGMLDRGKLLSGGIEQIAKAGRGFPQALRDPSTFGGEKPHSTLDIAAAIMLASHGHVAPAAAVFARPAARKYLLSEGYQNRMIPTGSDPKAAAVGSIKEINNDIKSVMGSKAMADLSDTERKQVEALQKEREGVVNQATRAGMKKADIAAALREEARQ